MGLFKKTIRSITIQVSLPDFDLNYAYDITVCETLLLKIPADVEVRNLTVVGAPQRLQLDK